MALEQAHLVDTDVFVACAREGADPFGPLSTTRRDVPFLIPPHVYEELHSDPGAYATGPLPIDDAIRDGWVTVTKAIDRSNETVADVLSEARRFVAEATDRPVDAIEKTDVVLVGIAAQLLDEGRAQRASVYTGDRTTGQAAERLLPQHGFDADRIEWVDGAEFLDGLESGR